MGYASARDVADHFGLEQALDWHLQSNHYPPLPVALVPTCIAAINAYVEEDYERRIDLPEGLQYRNLSTSIPASAVVEACHLDAFVDAACDEDIDLEDEA